MSKVTRADWAAQVPVSGIIGTLPSSDGVTDIGELKAASFATGQYPQWNGAKFIGAVPPSSTGAILSKSLIYPFVTWSSNSLLPLESTTGIAYVPDVNVGDFVMTGISISLPYVLMQAQCLISGQIQYLASNMSPSTVTLNNGVQQTWMIK